MRCAQKHFPDTMSSKSSTIICANHKGGVGKSTLSGMCALHSAHAGNAVLFLDLDPQTSGADNLPVELTDRYEGGDLSPKEGRITAVTQEFWEDARGKIADGDIQMIVDMPAGILNESAWDSFKPFFAPEVGACVVVPMQFSPLDIRPTLHFLTELERMGAERILLVLNAMRLVQHAGPALSTMKAHLEGVGIKKTKLHPTAIGHWSSLQNLSAMSSPSEFRKEHREVLKRLWEAINKR